MYLCIYVYMYMYICIYVYMHICLNVYLYICICMYYVVYFLCFHLSNILKLISINIACAGLQTRVQGSWAKYHHVTATDSKR